MKIWIKFLLGAAIGVILGFVLPAGNEKIHDVFSFIQDLIINIGRYTLLPLIFFSLSYGTFELKQEGKVVRVYGRLILYTVLITFLLVLIGSVSVIIFSPSRIPIINESAKVMELPGIKNILLQLFPKNFFHIFTYEGNLLYPLIFLSFLLGINFNFDRLITKPVVQFFDSISRVFYHINSLVIELIGFGIIPLAANLVLQLRINPERILFKQLALILGIDSVIIIFGVFPLILYFFGGRQNPYKWIYAALSSAIAGFVSRDSFFTLSILTKHGRESYGIPRKVGSAVFPLLSMIGKAGTAMVASVGFLLIIKSYSSLGITWFQFFWVLLFTFLTSFLLGSAPATGSLVAISFLCKFYGRGIEEGYLILNGIMLILISFGVLIDVISHSVIALLVTKHENLHQEIETNNFI